MPPKTESISVPESMLPHYEATIALTDAGKIFASFYAMYSGVVLLASVGVLAAPILHRFMHRFHLQDER
jgi:hypothetical protein